MKMSEALESAINKQINAEMYSSYLYLSMAAYMESENYKGMAQWMHAQAHEETTHARKFYGYVFERNGRVILDAIGKPPSDWDSVQAVFEDTLKHEQKVTAMIDKLADQADKDGDRAAAIFLQWFINEQVEEESGVQEIVDRMKMFGNVPQALYMLDRELGQRGQA